jgi:hypothetical protein
MDVMSAYGLLLHTVTSMLQIGHPTSAYDQLSYRPADVTDGEHRPREVVATTTLQALCNHLLHQQSPIS